jgi:hypothetical protein
MASSEKRCGPGAAKELEEREKEMLRNEFYVMQKCDFAFIKEIGATNADEYIVKITSLDFSHKKASE